MGKIPRSPSFQFHQALLDCATGDAEIDNRIKHFRENGNNRNLEQLTITPRPSATL
jgi:hypothetical protein